MKTYKKKSKIYQIKIISLQLRIRIRKQTNNFLNQKIRFKNFRIKFLLQKKIIKLAWE